MHPGEGLAETVRLGIDDEIDIPLAVKRHVRAEAQALEQLAQSLGIEGGVFDEFESIGAHGVGPGLGCGLRVCGHGGILARNMAVGWLIIYVGIPGMSLSMQRCFG